MGASFCRPTHQRTHPTNQSNVHSTNRLTNQPAMTIKMTIARRARAPGSPASVCQAWATRSAQWRGPPEECDAKLAGLPDRLIVELMCACPLNPSSPHRYRGQMWLFSNRAGPPAPPGGTASSSVQHGREPGPYNQAQRDAGDSICNRSRTK